MAEQHMRCVVLNGWRRIGVVAIAIWTLCVAGYAWFEFHSSRITSSHERFFVYRSPPLDPIFKDTNVVELNGTMISLEARDLYGRPIDRKELDLEIPPLPLRLNWSRLVTFVLLGPAAAWLLVEILIYIVFVVFSWVAEGFHAHKRR